MSADRPPRNPVESEMSKCIHFAGIQHDTCAAGVNYQRLLGGPRFGWAKHLPCLADPEAIVCEQRRFPTRDEAEATVREMDTACAAALNHIAHGTPLPPGVTVMVCRREDLGPYGEGGDDE